MIFAADRTVSAGLVYHLIEPWCSRRVLYRGSIMIIRGYGHMISGRGLFSAEQIDGILIDCGDDDFGDEILRSRPRKEAGS